MLNFPQATPRNRAKGKDALIELPTSTSGDLKHLVRARPLRSQCLPQAPGPGWEVSCAWLREWAQKSREHATFSQTTLRESRQPAEHAARDMLSFCPHRRIIGLVTTWCFFFCFLLASKHSPLFSRGRTGAGGRLSSKEGWRFHSLAVPNLFGVETSYRLFFTLPFLSLPFYRKVSCDSFFFFLKYNSYENVGIITSSSPTYTWEKPDMCSRQVT